jgi:hypothetical protein
MQQLCGLDRYAVTLLFDHEKLSSYGGRAVELLLRAGPYYCARGSPTITFCYWLHVLSLAASPRRAAFAATFLARMVSIVLATCADTSGPGLCAPSLSPFPALHHFCLRFFDCVPCLSMSFTGSGKSVGGVYRWLAGRGRAAGRGAR